MPDEKWWLKKFNEKNWGACFECCDYEGMVDDIRGILASHSRRIAETVEGMKGQSNASLWGAPSGWNAALDAVIEKLTKGYGN